MDTTSPRNPTDAKSSLCPLAAGNSQEIRRLDFGLTYATPRNIRGASRARLIRMRYYRGISRIPNSERKSRPGVLKNPTWNFAHAQRICVTSKWPMAPDRGPLDTASWKSYAMQYCSASHDAGNRPIGGYPFAGYATRLVSSNKRAVVAS